MYIVFNFFFKNIKFTKILPFIFVGISLTGCGGRNAHPIAATNPTDRIFDCAGISREFLANERSIQATLKERTLSQGKNVAVGAAGLVFFPAWFFLDPKSPEKKEIDALRNRNKVLEDINLSKVCGPIRSQMNTIYK
jgi:hypothetical protein